MYLLILIDVLLMHNNTNYQCKICWNKALTFGVGSIQLSFRIYHCVHPIHANMFSIQMLLHFSQIVPRVCTLVLSLLLFEFIISAGGCDDESSSESDTSSDITDSNLN